MTHTSFLLDIQLGLTIIIAHVNRIIQCSNLAIRLVFLLLHHSKCYEYFDTLKESGYDVMRLHIFVVVSYILMGEDIIERKKESNEIIEINEKRNHETIISWVFAVVCVRTSIVYQTSIEGLGTNQAGYTHAYTHAYTLC